MSDKFVMSVRQADELDHAFERNNWTPEDVKRLSSGTVLSQILPVVRGNANVVAVKHVIDCDASPFVPEGGQFKWDPATFASS